MFIIIFKNNKILNKFIIFRYKNNKKIILNFKY